MYPVRCLFAALICIGAINSCLVLTTSGLAQVPTTKAVELRKLDSKHLPNAIQVREGLLSGGLPESQEAFEELNRMGIQTIISVDGAKPDVAMAERYQMRYVHIPHGYDGVPEATIKTLVKAVSELPGPIYVHCHHGKHRSPAAVAALCVAQGSLTPEEGLKLLEIAGTNPSYKGLFQSVRHAKRIDPSVLAELQIEFPSARLMPPLVDAMVALDETFAKLNKVAQGGWKAKADFKQIDVAHEAVLLREHFEELKRLEDVGKYSADFAKMLDDSERAAWFIESMLNATGESPVLSSLKAIHRTAIEVNWTTIRSNCSSCHQQFRDPPR